MILSRRLPAVFTLLSFSLAVACSDSSSSVSDFTCEAGACASDGGGVPPADGGGGGSSGSSGSGIPPADAAQTGVYCSAASGNNGESICVCNTALVNGLTAGTPCGPAQVGAPALCCAPAGWPNVPPGPLGYDCTCSKISCKKSKGNDFCSCDAAETDPVTDVSVPSCSGAPWVKCCKSTSSSICACYDSDVTCMSDETPVSSCSVSDAVCGTSAPTVAACK